MTIALDHLGDDGRTSVLGATAASATTGLLGVAGLASLGAGAIHAAAIGVHAEHRTAVVAFTAVAALQLGWGAVALVRRDRLVALAGAATALVALGGWALAKTTGIAFVAGLDEAEAIQTADGLAAAFALASLLLVVLAARSPRAGRSAARLPLAPAAAGVAALTIFGMLSAGSHAHAATGGGGGGHHGADGAVAAGADDHDEGHAEEAAGDGHVDGDDHAAGDGHAVAATVPYDPALPIDLGGLDGVTPEQQAAAENLVAVTLHGLPQWSDPEVALAAGFRSIGDGSTGIEHFVNDANIDDPTILDPDVPESLVYDTSSGERRLVAAMYMTERGLPLEDVPDIGGALMQWHTHDNLCYTAEGLVRGITDAAGDCPAGLIKPEETPMIHVWIEAHPCGPFAALEGIGGGRIADGEERLCDTAHGGH